MPFKLLGIDSDNDSEFSNAHLFKFCQDNLITFTRARAYKKNDNCFVEQKNWSVVRRAVGYSRYDSDKELFLLNKLYASLRLYTNFFMPSMKLIEKSRIGSRIKKIYDTPKSPFRRLLVSDNISNSVKDNLVSTFKSLNPALLKKQISNIQNKLAIIQKLKPKNRDFNDFLLYNYNQASNTTFV